MLEAYIYIIVILHRYLPQYKEAERVGGGVGNIL